MAAKKNLKKKSYSPSTDIFGIAIIFISSVALVCLILPFLLGIVGSAVKGFLTGVFGLAAYAVFLSLLVLGILMLRNRPIGLKLKYSLSIAAVFISVIAILHLATSYTLLSDSFGTYIKHCYNSGLTAGGVIMSLLVYPIYAITNQAFVYVLYSLIIVLCILVFTDFRVFALFKRRKTQDTEMKMFFTDKDSDTNITSGPVRSEGNSLYVENIYNAKQDKAHSKGTLFSSKSYKDKPLNNEFGSKPESLFNYSENKTSYNNPNIKAEDYKKSEAYQRAAKELFGNRPSNQEPEKPVNNFKNFNYEKNDGREYSYNQPPTKPEVNENYSDYSRDNRMPPKSTGVPDIKYYREEEKPVENAVKNRPPKFMHGSQSGEEHKRGESKSFYDNRSDSRREETASDIVFNNPFKTTSAFANTNTANSAFAAASSANSTNNNVVQHNEDKPVSNTSRRAMYSQPEFPYVPEPVKNFSYNENPNPIINGDEFAKQKPLSTAQDEQITVRREQPSQFASEERREIRKDPEITREKPAVYEEGAPVDYTGRYTVLPPVEDKSKKELFENKVASFEELYPNLKPARKTSIKEKDDNQIPIEEFVSRSAESIKPARARKSGKRYVSPPLEMLDKIENQSEDSDDYIQEKARILEETLSEFKVNAKVVEVTRGPAVTRYELQMPPGISVKNVEKYSEDIAYRLASNGKMRIETPIPGKTAVGIEVPNSKISIVGLRDIIGSKEFDNSTSPLTFSLGKDIAGSSVVCNLIKMPHLLIAGATGSGKSACLNSLIVSLIYKSSPEDLKLILIDPKRVEFAIFADIPHLLTGRIINETEHTINAFNWAINEMERRYLLLNKFKVKDIGEYNNSQLVKDGSTDKLPYIVMVVDELADLMLNAKRDVEDKIRNIAQKARASGIHLVLATQRPSVDVITGTIKANLPSRIAFSVSSFPDSKTILDQGGAESLLGRGDMLYSPVEMHEPIRIQGAFVTTAEVNSVVNFVKENNECIFDEEAAEFIFAKKEEPVSTVDDNNGNPEDEYDTRLKDAARIGIELKQISISLVQRKLYIGYARAARIIDQLEKYKFISPFDGTSKARQVYMTAEDFKNFFGEEF